MDRLDPLTAFNPEDDLDYDDRSSNSEIDPELEIALYSQIHFDYNPDIPLSLNESLHCSVEEEILEENEPDSQDSNWRERILENLAKSSCKKEDVPNSNQRPSAKTLPRKGSFHTPILRNTPSPLVSRTGKNAKSNSKNDDAQKQLSALLIRDEEPENKLDALKNKKVSRVRTSTVKSSPVITVTEDSSDSDTDLKELSAKDMIVIDSITDTESDNETFSIDKKRDLVNLIDSDDEDENNFVVKKIAYSSDSDNSDSSSGNVRKTVISTDSSDVSVCELELPADIQIHATGLLRSRNRGERRIEKGLATIFNDHSSLGDCKDLTVEELLNSMPECDWSLAFADRTPGSTLTSRYFRKFDVKCHNCNERGHLSRECSQPRKQPVCIYCGLEGHLCRACPLKCCYNCYRIGHGRESCTEPKKKFYLNCNRCRLKGHEQSECTDIWRQFHLTTKPDELKKGSRKMNMRRYCFNCARKGHFGYECRGEMMDRFKWPQYPFIARYCKSLPLHGPSDDFQYQDYDEAPYDSNKERKIKRHLKIMDERKKNRRLKTKEKYSTPKMIKTNSFLESAGQMKNKEKKKKANKRSSNTESVASHPDNITVTTTYSTGNSKSRKNNKRQKKKQKSEYEGDFQRSVSLSGGQGQEKTRKRKSDQDVQTGFQRGAKRARYKEKRHEAREKKDVSEHRPFTSERGFSTKFHGHRGPKAKNRAGTSKQNSSSNKTTVPMRNLK